MEMKERNFLLRLEQSFTKLPAWNLQHFALHQEQCLRPDRTGEARVVLSQWSTILLIFTMCLHPRSQNVTFVVRWLHIDVHKASGSSNNSRARGRGSPACNDQDGNDDEDTLQEYRQKEVLAEHKREIHTLKQDHRLQLEEKDRNIRQLVDNIRHLVDNYKETCAKHKSKVQVCEHVMLSQEEELLGVQLELEQAKAELERTSSVLIQTQHLLHDLSASWPVQLFGARQELNKND